MDSHYLRQLYNAWPHWHSCPQLKQEAHEGIKEAEQYEGRAISTLRNNDWDKKNKKS